MAEKKHRFFVAWPDSSSELYELPEPVWSGEPLAEVRYPLAVLAEAIKELRGEGLHFYLTKDPDHLPEYGPHVVAVVLEEERCKIPAYARHVRAVIRNMQTTPFAGFRMHASMGRLELVETFEYFRDWALHLRSRSQLGRFRSADVPRVTEIPRILTIPLGYHSQQELPLVPMRERTLDSFFSGDVRSHYARNDYRYWTSTSKVEARRQLWKALEDLPNAERQPAKGWNILRNQVNSAKGDRPAVYGSYSERMQQSRICLAPRGSVAETFRIFEGLRAGCLVMTNPLPDFPFLTGAPLVIVDNWKHLPELLTKYGLDLPALDERSRASRQWWDEKCSEPVVGRLVAEALNRLV